MSTTRDAPRFRRMYPWTPEQESLFQAEFSKGRSFTAQYLLGVLRRACCINGCTLEDVQLKMSSENKRLLRWEKKDGKCGLEEIYKAIEMLRGDDDEDVDELDDDVLTLLPLEGADEQYVIVDGEEGVDFKKLTNQVKPKLLEDGRAYAFSIPAASRRSLLKVLKAHENVYWHLRSVTLLVASQTARPMRTKVGSHPFFKCSY